MKIRLRLALDFIPDHDEVAVVTAYRDEFSDSKPVMNVNFNFCTGPNGDEHQITTKVLQEGGLVHYAQAEIILAGSKLVDSVFSGEDAPSVIEV